MKVCVLSFSGNVGKSTIAAHVFQPRMRAQVFSVESLNIDAESDGLDVDRLRAKQYDELLRKLMKLEHAIIDVGSSNVELFLKLMQHHAGSEEEFDLFVVPTVKEAKQQRDTVNTVDTLRHIGIAAEKIRIVINKAETDDDIEADFAALIGYCKGGDATLSLDSVIFSNEVFGLLKEHGITLGDLNADTTDYRQQLRAATTDAAKDQAIAVIAMKRLAKTCTENLDRAYQVLMSGPIAQT